MDVDCRVWEKDVVLKIVDGETEECGFDNCGGWYLTGCKLDDIVEASVCRVLLRKAVCNGFPVC